MKDDRERKLWLVVEVALESRMFAQGDGEKAAIRRARGLAFLDMGHKFELISDQEHQRLGDALLAKEGDETAFLDMLD